MDAVIQDWIEGVNHDRPVVASRTVVCFGDSLAEGQYGRPEDAWPALLDAVNLGRANDTTRLALERWPDVVAARPDVVVIQFGTNDANRWEADRGLPRVSLDAYAANMREILDRSDSIGAAPVVCSIIPSLRKPLNSWSRAYDAAALMVAHNAGVTVCDVRVAFLARGDMRLLFRDDGVHLSPVGHRVYADAVRGVL